MDEGIRFWLNSPGSTQNGAAKCSTRSHVPRALGSCSPRWWGAAGIKGSHWFLQTNRRKCKNNSRDNFRFYRVCPGSFRVAGFCISWNNKQVMEGGQSGIPRRGWRQGRESLGGLVSQSAVRGHLHAEALLLETSPGRLLPGWGSPAPACTVGSSQFTGPMPSVPTSQIHRFPSQPGMPVPGRLALPGQSAWTRLLHTGSPARSRLGSLV